MRRHCPPLFFSAHPSRKADYNAMCYEPHEVSALRPNPSRHPKEGTAERHIQKNNRS